MKKLLVSIYFIAMSILSVSAFEPEATQSVIGVVSNFLSQTVNVDGHGVSGSIKMWQSLLALSIPVLLFGGAILVGYVRYRKAESKRFATR